MNVNRKDGNALIVFVFGVIAIFLIAVYFFQGDTHLRDIFDQKEPLKTAALDLSGQYSFGIDQNVGGDENRVAMTGTLNLTQANKKLIGHCFFNFSASNKSGESEEAQSRVTGDVTGNSVLLVAEDVIETGPSSSSRRRSDFKIMEAHFNLNVQEEGETFTGTITLSERDRGHTIPLDRLDEYKAYIKSLPKIPIIVRRIH